MKTDMHHKIKENPCYDFKRIHLYGIVWFLVSVIFLIVIAIKQMGFHWWVVFSVSGYSAIVVLFLVLLYGFAIYKGVVRNLNNLEHPLTTSPYYILLYDAAPFLGCFTGLCVVSWDQTILSRFLVAAQGTLIMTFVMWIVIDSTVGLAEASFPRSVVHRKRRLANNQRKKRHQILERKRLLDRITQQEKQTRSQWICFFQPYAVEVADLLCNPSGNAQGVQRRIVELGAMAWRRGELLGMKFFHEVILEEVKRRAGHPSVDFVSVYWDGIGTWRKPSKIEQMYI